MAFDIIADRKALHDASRKFILSLQTDELSRSASVATWETYAADIPLKTIFEPLYSPNDKGMAERPALPTSAECAVHLEFLQTLFILRQRILKSEDMDDVFNVHPANKVVKRKGEDVKLKDDTFWTRRQEKWEKFIRLAVIRFLLWWESLRSIYNVPEGEGVEIHISHKSLPPLDVLMVWHSFLLNPSFYRQLCGKKLLYRMEFPWASIHQAINSNTWQFELSVASQEKFTGATGLEPDLEQLLLSSKSSDRFLAKVILDKSAESLENPHMVSSILRHLNVNDPYILSHLSSGNTTLIKDLSAAVERQTSFVDKMSERLWIRSPYLEGTLRRSITRYSNFLALYKHHPNTMFVPTLDIDLVWHTHQCSAQRYYTNTRALAGKFLNHDDSLEETVLGTGFEKTSALYRARFGTDYSICGCWDCEGLIELFEQHIETDDESAKGWDPDIIAIIVGRKVKKYREIEALRRKPALVVDV